MARRKPSLVVAACAAASLLAGCSGAATIASKSPASTSRSSAPRSSPAPPPSTAAPSQGLPPRSVAPNTPRRDFGPGPAGHGLQRFYHQHVTWKACGPRGDQCATIWVPLDYHHPDGQSIIIATKRQPATDPAEREGSLFINPGGPGGSGIDYLSYVDFGSSVTAHYDIVGFDPRGVGRSTPVECVSDRALDTYVASDPTPDTAAEIRRMQQLWTHFTRGCVQHTGPLLGHVSTIEAAKDMDILRAVVGDAKLNYFGASYGTYLGATYAALFPTKVRRMVLDGAIDPLESPHASEIGQAAGFQRALDAYLRYCIGQGSCPLGSSVPAAEQRLNAFFKQVDRHPLPTSSSRRLTEGLAWLGVIVPLYSRANWQYETLALSQALQGNGAILLRLSDAYTSRNPDGTYKDNSMQVQSAVNCLDKPEHATLKQIEAGKGAFLKASPVFGPAAMWWPYACSNWPKKPSWPQPDYAAPGAPPIVVIGTTRDPATPYEQAVRLSKELDSGVLLSRNGDGHTAYDSGNPCIDDAVNNYLVTGTPPKPGTMC
ncbi:MAG TPA: alpha/beta hydrolase [Nocardioidaceae bacterium]|nr:alpha/beta hydrolase [Nocardioidaceae bacterium]